MARDYLSELLRGKTPLDQLEWVANVNTPESISCPGSPKAPTAFHRYTTGLFTFDRPRTIPGFSSQELATIGIVGVYALPRDVIE